MSVSHSEADSMCACSHTLMMHGRLVLVTGEPSLTYRLECTAIIENDGVPVGTCDCECYGYARIIAPFDAVETSE